MGYGSIIGRTKKASSFYPTITISGVPTGKTPTIQKGQAVAIADNSSGSWIAKPWAFGTYSIVIDGQVSGTVKVTQLVNYNFTNTAVTSLSLNDMSWNSIAVMSTGGFETAVPDYGIATMSLDNVATDEREETVKTVPADPANFWAVGDSKEIKLKGTVGKTKIDTTMYAFILGFEHNKRFEGNHKIHFGLGWKKADYSDTGATAICDAVYGALATSDKDFAVNPYKSNSRGWERANIRNLLGTIDEDGNITKNSLLSCFPDELKNLLKVTKKYVNYDDFDEYLTLMSEKEVFGESTHSEFSDNEEQYDYFKMGTSKVFYNGKNPVKWALRTPDKNNETNFCCVNEQGDIDSIEANVCVGIVPVFFV